MRGSSLGTKYGATHIGPGRVSRHVRTKQYLKKSSISSHCQVCPNCKVLLAAERGGVTIRLNRFPFFPKDTSPPAGRDTLIRWLQAIDLRSIHLILQPIKIDPNGGSYPTPRLWTDAQEQAIEEQFKLLFPEAALFTISEPIIESARFWNFIEEGEEEEQW